jgi:hypothetical protein
MQTLRVGRGYTARWVVTLRDERGAPVADTYLGTEALTLTICDLAGLPVTLLTSSVAWLDAAVPTVTLTVDNSDTTDMAAGPRGLSIALDDGGEPTEVYRAVLRVEPR